MPRIGDHVQLIWGIFTHFSALMGVVMNLAFLFAGSTSTNPQILVVGLSICFVGGVAVGYYGLDSLPARSSGRSCGAHLVLAAQSA
jgi:thiosulfate dehydrogenase [quinone] large subunit